MYIQTNFNIANCLEKLGYKDIEKEREGLVKKDNIIIYYSTQEKLSLGIVGYQIGMKICQGDKIVYDGIVPQSEELLIDLLDLLFPDNELLKKIGLAMYERMLF